MRIVLVLVLGLATVGCTGATTSGAGPTATSAGSPSAQTAAESPRSVALAEATRLVGIVRTPDRASPESHAPVPTLRKPASRPASPFLLDVPGWWSLPLSTTNAVSWLRAHPPARLAVSGHGSGTGLHGPFAYLIYSDAPAPSYNQATLLIEVAPDGHGGSAIRADGQALWIPHRPAAEEVRADASRVRLLARRGTGAVGIVARATVSGEAAATLVRLADGLVRDNRGVVSCAFDAGFRTSATFLSTERTLVFTEVPACGSVSVTLDGHSLPGLLDNQAFRRAISVDLGSG